MTDNLLKEAIADAKAVRDMAYAEAKAKLEEAFKPHLTTMLSARLRDEAAITEGLEDTSGIGGGAVTVKDPGPKEPSNASNNTSGIGTGKQEFETFGDGSAEKKPLQE